MKAVNLLPPDLRGATKVGVASVREPVAGFGAYVVLGALALCVAALAGYVLAGNSIKQRKAELADANARNQVATQQANALKPYADFLSMSQARIDTVKGVVAARFDWEQALRDISRAVPGDVVFSELDGDLGIGGTAAGGSSGGSSLRGSIAAPAIELKGCAPSQPEVARLMAHLRDVEGVSRVSLASSDKGENASGSTQTTGCSGAQPPQFDVLVFFENSAAAKALAPPPSSGTGSPAGVPVPNSINGGGGSSKSGAGSSAAGSSASSTSSSSTTTGATP